MARDKKIRVNETELDTLKRVRDEYFSDYPLGAVVRELAEARDDG